MPNELTAHLARKQIDAAVTFSKTESEIVFDHLVKRIDQELRNHATQQSTCEFSIGTYESCLGPKDFLVKPVYPQNDRSEVCTMLSSEFSARGIHNSFYKPFSDWKNIQCVLSWNIKKPWFSSMKTAKQISSPSSQQKLTATDLRGRLLTNAIRLQHAIDHFKKETDDKIHHAVDCGLSKTHQKISTSYYCRIDSIQKHNYNRSKVAEIIRKNLNEREFYVVVRCSILYIEW